MADRQVDIAIVDDDKNLAMMLREYMRNRGLDAVAFNSAEDILGDNPSRFNAIVLDIMLPGMWGSECAASLRSGGYSGAVIGITGHIDDWDPEDLADLGFDQVFAKPFEPDDILSCIRDRLGQAGEN